MRREIRRTPARAGLRSVALALMVLLSACDDKEYEPNERVEDAWRYNAHVELPIVFKYLYRVESWNDFPTMFVGLGDVSGRNPRDTWLILQSEVRDGVPAGRTVWVRPRQGAYPWNNLIGVGHLRVRISRCAIPCNSPAALSYVTEASLDPADTIQPPVGSFEGTPWAFYVIEIEGPAGPWLGEYEIVIESH